MEAPRAGYWLSVELCVAHHQTGWNLHTRPAIAQRRSSTTHGRRRCRSQCEGRSRCASTWHRLAGRRVVAAEDSRARGARGIRQPVAPPSRQVKLVRVLSVLSRAGQFISTHTDIVVTSGARVIASSFSHGAIARDARTHRWLRHQSGFHVPGSTFQVEMFRFQDPASQTRTRERDLAPVAWSHACSQ